MRNNRPRSITKDGKLPISEKAFTAQVIALAKYCGWRVYHHLPAMNRRGKWASHTQGDVGFPDLVLARNGEVLFVELKTDSKQSKLTDEQVKWQQALGFVYWNCWRPRDWEGIKAILGATS